MVWNCVCRHTKKPIILKGYVKVRAQQQCPRLPAVNTGMNVQLRLTAPAYHAALRTTTDLDASLSSWNAGSIFDTCPDSYQSLKQLQHMHSMRHLLPPTLPACAQAKMTERNFSQVRREIRLMSIIR